MLAVLQGNEGDIRIIYKGLKEIIHETCDNSVQYVAHLAFHNCVLMLEIYLLA